MFNFRRRKRLQSAKRVRKYNRPIAIRIQNLKDSLQQYPDLGRKKPKSPKKACATEKGLNLGKIPQIH